MPNVDSMAGHDAGEDFFDDDDLDELPNSALIELENDAIQFTQAQTQARRPPPPSSDYGDEFEDEDLDDAVVIDESKSTPVIVTSHNNRFNAGSAITREQFRQNRYGTNSRPVPSVHPHDPPNYNQLARLPSHPLPSNRISTQSQRPFSASQQDSQLVGEAPRHLEQHIEELVKEIGILKDSLHAKVGEISIVRSKHEKTVKEYERELGALRKLNEDKLAQQQKALEAARHAENNAAIEKEFLQRELLDEASKNRRLIKEKRVEGNDGLVTTPKKKKAQPHRDGFDDNEIQMLSPSKMSPSKFQKRSFGSPSKPGKRKRKTDDSPAGQLQLQVEDSFNIESQLMSTTFNEALVAKLAIRDDRYDFLGNMLDHRLNGNYLRTVEELGKYALPSAPDESLEALILGKLPAIGFKKSSISVEFCEILLGIWKDCVRESYYAPVRLLIDIVTFALELTTPTIAAQLVMLLVPIAQDTADLVFVPRYKRSPKLPEAEIDGTACMSLLHLVAQGCMSHQKDIILFWELMRPDFIQCTLSPNQIRADFEIMLCLLSTSVMKDSFGSIGPFEYLLHRTQTRDILSRLMHFIAEVPLMPLTGERFTAEVLSKERIKILQLMTAMLHSSHAGREIAAHPQMIGELVSLLSNELDLLYDYNSGYDDSARIISLVTRLLYQVITKYDDIIDMQKKLEVVRGGNHKYLLCLSRLSYIEDDLVLEAGIDKDVVELAVELLERKVTPEEGEAIFAAFVSP